MDFSIIVVTYNSSSNIEACLHSVKEAMKELDHEILIVDNASQDETCRIVEKEFPQVFLIKSEVNLGFAKANNLGLQRAKGEFVLLINPDTVWKKGEAGQALRFLRNHPEIGAMGCRLILEDGSWQRSHGNFPTLWKELKGAFHLPGLFPRWKWMEGVYTYKESHVIKPVEWISCTFFLSRKETLAEVAGFDERYFMYYEDIDLSKRLRGKGKEIYYFPEIEVIHYQKQPSMIDYGGSPYIYFCKFFPLSFAKVLKYIMILKTSVRMAIFPVFVLFSEKKVYREKARSNRETFKFHFCRASRIIRDLTVESRKKAP
jgi:GT2 family glycosyltransferase